MKKIIHYLGGMVLALAVASCSSEEPVPAQGENPSVGTTEVTFSGTIPSGIRSRATETSQIQQLWCAVYDLEGNPVDKREYRGDELKALLKEGKFQVSFTLAKDTKYKAFFLGDDFMEGHNLIGCDLDKKEVWLDEATQTVTGIDEYLGAYCCLMDIDTKVNASYQVVMKSIFAEVWLVSNQTETPEFLSKYPGRGAGTTFGKPDSPTGNGYFLLPDIWNFWDDTIVNWEKFDFEQSVNFSNESLVSIMCPVEGCHTLYAIPMLAQRQGTTFAPQFFIRDEQVDWQGYEISPEMVTILNLPSRTFRQNTRTIYVDKGNGLSGGTEQADFSVLVSNDLQQVHIK